MEQENLLEELSDLQRRTRLKLRNLGRASDEAWAGLRGMNAAWSQLEGRYREAVSIFGEA